MLLLTQFIYRLTFGLALAMLLVPARHVTSGYFRNNLYVLLGLNVLAALVSLRSTTAEALPLWPAASCVAVAYAGTIAWLYGRSTAGKVLLAALMVLACAGGLLTLRAPAELGHLSLAALAMMASGLLMGATFGSMLLGHWYLNAPGMPLEPLRRLLLLLAAAIALRAAMAGWGTWIGIAHAGQVHDPWLFIGLRWLSGIAGTLLLTVMAWKTLKIPNTQSATGILYVAVITTLLGELTAGLLARNVGWLV